MYYAVRVVKMYRLNKIRNMLNFRVAIDQTKTDNSSSMTTTAATALNIHVYIYIYIQTAMHILGACASMYIDMTERQI